MNIEEKLEELKKKKKRMDEVKSRLKRIYKRRVLIHRLCLGNIIPKPLGLLKNKCPFCQKKLKKKNFKSKEKTFSFLDGEYPYHNKFIKYKYYRCLCRYEYVKQITKGMTWVLSYSEDI